LKIFFPPAHYNAGVVAVNSKAVGLAPGLANCNARLLADGIRTRLALKSILKGKSKPNFFISPRHVFDFTHMQDKRRQRVALLKFLSCMLLPPRYNNYISTYKLEVLKFKLYLCLIFAITIVAEVNILFHTSPILG
jgi:hypothetical protein